MNGPCNTSVFSRLFLSRAMNLIFPPSNRQSQAKLDRISKYTASKLASLRCPFCGVIGEVIYGLYPQFLVCTNSFCEEEGVYYSSKFDTVNDVLLRPEVVDPDSHQARILDLYNPHQR